MNTFKTIIKWANRNRDPWGLTGHRRQRKRSQNHPSFHISRSRESVLADIVHAIPRVDYSFQSVGINWLPDNNKPKFTSATSNKHFSPC